MNNLSDIRKRFSQKLTDLETKFAQQTQDFSFRMQALKAENTTVKPAAKKEEPDANHPLDLHLEPVGENIEIKKEHDKLLEQRYAMIEENYEHEIARLQKELAESHKREIELSSGMKNIREEISSAVQPKNVELERIVAELVESRKKEDQSVLEIDKFKKIIAELIDREDQITNDIKIIKDEMLRKDDRKVEDSQQQELIERLEAQLEEANKKIAGLIADGDSKQKEVISRLEAELAVANKMAEGVTAGDDAPQKETVSRLESQLSETNSKMADLQKSLNEKEKYLKDMIKSTSEFLDSALKQEQTRITGIADKTVNVLLEKKEYELALKNLKEEHEKLKDDLFNKESLLDKLLAKNSKLMEQMENNVGGATSISELKVINSELTSKVDALEKEIEKFKVNTYEPIKNEKVSEEDKPKDDNVAQESLRVINTFIGWLGEPTIQVDLEKRAAAEKPGQASTSDQQQKENK